jgi:hypothetical protein
MSSGQHDPSPSRVKQLRSRFDLPLFHRLVCGGELCTVDRIKRTLEVLHESVQTPDA